MGGGLSQGLHPYTLLTSHQLSSSTSQPGGAGMGMAYPAGTMQAFASGHMLPVQHPYMMPMPASMVPMLQPGANTAMVAKVRCGSNGHLRAS